ncbi:hypothetical protein Tco_0921169 [Tanacetum coccineum]
MFTGAFNHCLTIRTSGNDQTKINIHQIFHAMVNRVHVGYAALIWWDFLNYVLQKKDVIQYPRFTKLIIAALMKKYSSIPQRLEEDYHSIQDDIPLASVYSMGNVTVRGMLIPNEFITDNIRATEEYKEYMKVFGREEEITKMVKGEEDEESYASEFVDSMLNDDDDSSTMIEPGSHKEYPKTVNDDDENEKKDDDKKDKVVSREDDAPPEGEKRVKRHKTSKSSWSSKSARSSSSKQPASTYVFERQQQQDWDG